MFMFLEQLLKNNKIYVSCCFVHSKTLQEKTQENPYSTLKYQENSGFPVSLFEENHKPFVFTGISQPQDHLNGHGTGGRRGAWQPVMVGRSIFPAQAKKKTGLRAAVFVFCFFWFSKVKTAFLVFCFEAHQAIFPKQKTAENKLPALRSSSDDLWSHGISGGLGPRDGDEATWKSTLAFFCI